MKKNSFLWAALSMTAALVMTACSNDDNDMTEAPVAPSTSKTIPYTVTVGGDEATTRATVDGDNKTLRFATDDKLYITGTNIKGMLSITDGVGESSGATFSGELTYDGSGTPADDLSLTATLVSAQQTDGSEVTINATTGAVTVNYPTTAYCSSINDAVQKYSNLTGTSTYGARAFTLTQQTAFLNFEITFEDGTATSTSLSAKVNNNSSNICTANVTTTTESTKVVAKFVLPVAAGTTLSSAKVTMGSKAAISFGASQTLTGKVYNVKKTQYKMAAAATNADLGKVIGADGNIYVNADAATAASTTAVAIIAYVGSAGSVDASSSTYKGLAIALTDANSGSTCQWYTDKSGTCVSQTNAIATAITYKNGIESTTTLTNGHSSHTHAAAAAAKNFSTGRPTGASAWFLPSMGQWNLIIQGLATKKAGSTVSTNLSTSGNNAYKASNLNSVITGAGGTGFQSDRYWSSTEYNTDEAWSMRFDGGGASKYSKSDNRYVRAVFAF